MRSVPLHVSGNNSTWRVPPEGCLKTVIMLQVGNGWADFLEIMYMVSSPFKNYDSALEFDTEFDLKKSFA